MESPFNSVLSWLFATALIIVFGLPLAWMSVGRIRHKMRKRMVNSPRKIIVPAANAGASSPSACSHERSKNKARLSADGTYTSICKRCGTRMRRKGPGDWEVIGATPTDAIGSSPRAVDTD